MAVFVVGILLLIGHGVIGATRAFIARFGGPDLRGYEPVLRVVVAVLSATYRSAWRCLGASAFHHVCVIALFSLILLGAFWLYAEHYAPGAHSATVYAETWGACIFVMFLAVRFVVRLRDRLKDARPKGQIELELISVIRDWHSETTPAIQRAHRCVIEDRGPIRVMSINAIELIRPDLAGLDVKPTLDLAWQADSAKTFQWLLADPTSPAIRRRNARLNGRYIEYYVIRFLLMMFRWKQELDASGDRLPRIRFRMYDGEPTYRMVITEDNAVVQRYARFRHGREDAAYLIPRNGALDLHGYFLRAFNNCWVSRPGPDDPLDLEAEAQAYITRWSVERVRDLAMYCHVPARAVLPGHDRAKVTEVLCRHLDSLMPQLGLLEQWGRCRP